MPAAVAYGPQLIAIALGDILSRLPWHRPALLQFTCSRWLRPLACCSLLPTSVHFCWTLPRTSRALPFYLIFVHGQLLYQQ
jgi:hypothetical protein